MTHRFLILVFGVEIFSSGTKVRILLFTSDGSTRGQWIIRLVVVVTFF